MSAFLVSPEVVDALVHGRLSGREAIELGLVKFYGEAARSKMAVDWLSAITLRVQGS